jgi:hypothetical protein
VGVRLAKSAMICIHPDLLGDMVEHDRRQFPLAQMPAG